MHSMPSNNRSACSSKLSGYELKVWHHQPQTGINNQRHAPLSHFSQLQPARIRRAVNGQHIVLVAVIKKTETILETK
jgi:hypothetical protein